MTKVILLKDVLHIGQRGEIKDVKDGYLRNFLLPQKLAEIATPGKINSLERLVGKRRAEKEEMTTKAKTELAKVPETKLIFKVAVNEKGHLFEGIGLTEIEAKLQEAGFKNIKKEWIELEKPIKEVGEYRVKIMTPFGIETELALVITEIKKKARPPESKGLS